MPTQDEKRIRIVVDPSGKKRQAPRPSAKAARAVAQTFDKILADGIRRGQVPARTKKAREYYRKAAKAVTKPPTRSQLTEAKGKVTTKIEIR